LTYGSSHRVLTSGTGVSTAFGAQHLVADRYPDIVEICGQVAVMSRETLPLTKQWSRANASFPGAQPYSPPLYLSNFLAALTFPSRQQVAVLDLLIAAVAVRSQDATGSKRRRAEGRLLDPQQKWRVRRMSALRHNRSVLPGSTLTPKPTCESSCRVRNLDRAVYCGDFVTSLPAPCELPRDRAFPSPR
jgi:hypothetical protein